MGGGHASLLRDRVAGGRQLAERLVPYRQRPDSIVLGLARGGMQVAAEVARVLVFPLDVCPVRKLGVPGHGELAMDVIASGGARVMNQEVVGAFTPKPFRAVGLWYGDFPQVTDDQVRRLLAQTQVDERART